MSVEDSVHTSHPGGGVGEESCPKCGAETEPIDAEVEGFPLRQLQLCPQCYLVTWSDDNGFQCSQGIPVKDKVSN